MIGTNVCNYTVFPADILRHEMTDSSLFATDNPSRQFGRHVRVGRGGRLPLEILLDVARRNTSLKEAVAFFKMGFPLRDCMAGVGWPQNRYEPPVALFKPDPPIVEGCYACGYARRLCRCPLVIRSLPTFSLPLEGSEDEEGVVWPYYTQSMEDGYNGETYMVEHWSDELAEWSVAHALNGERVAHQLKNMRSDRLRRWIPADPLCMCFELEQPHHDAWETCSLRVFHDEMLLTQDEDAELQAELL